MMLMGGIGLLAAAIPVATARATRRGSRCLQIGCRGQPRRRQGATSSRTNSTARRARRPTRRSGNSRRSESPWKTRRSWELPENVGQYRDDRRNVYLDGKSNLVFHAAKDGNTYYSGKLFGKWRGGIGHTWEARIKLDCLTPGCWPAWYMANNNPVNGGEVDVMEWYGNGNWAAGTAVHAKLNGGEHVSQKITVDSAWHTWRVTWDDAGMRFWKDYTDGAQPYFNVPANSLPDWQFNDPGYQLFPVMDLAVAGSGGGDPGRGDVSGQHADRLRTRLVGVPGEHPLNSGETRSPTHPPSARGPAC